jgi:spore germination cell wall hydrolase CwlJ-like protein
MIDSIVAVLKQGILTVALLNPTVEDLRNDVYINIPAFCMAQNIYHEARGEELAGQIAVAHVTLNRVRHESYPNTICEVVYDGRYYTNWKGNEMPIRYECQFTWWCDGRSDTAHDKEAWEESLKIAILVMARVELDPTNGATHYYNPEKASPSWRLKFPVTAYIGDHTFCKLPARS